MAWNKGINFGLFESESVTQVYFLFLISVSKSIALFLWVRKTSQRPASVARCLESELKFLTHLRKLYKVPRLRIKFQKVVFCSTEHLVLRSF